MDVGRSDTLRGIVQNRVTDLQMLEVEVVMEEAVILVDAVVEVMVVTKTVGVMGKLEPLHHNMGGNGLTGERAHCYAFPGRS